MKTYSFAKISVMGMPTRLDVGNKYMFGGVGRIAIRPGRPVRGAVASGGRYSMIRDVVGCWSAPNHMLVTVTGISDDLVE